MTTVMLADDAPNIRNAVRRLLSYLPDIEVVAEVDNGIAAVERSLALLPDIVLMDVVMPGLNGVEATRQIVKANPSVKVLGLSMHASKRFVEEMLKAGASGYLLKESISEELMSAINCIVSGRRYLSSVLDASIMQSDSND